MIEKLIQLSNNHLDGLVSDREYLGQLISILGEKWQSMPEAGQGDAETAELAMAFTEA